jgi:ubiquinone/menaquinone biosynthesis C-methylase UbiE
MNTRNLDVYNSAEVASYYAQSDFIMPCEQFLFERYIRPGTTILDMGVGGGRTTRYLSRNGGRYVGVDYADQMVRTCQGKFPELEFHKMDASDLSYFPAMSFDVVVMSFNGIDSLDTEARLRCFGECYRVLKAGGVFIFSSHNPRAVLVRAAWGTERIRRIAQSWSQNWKGLEFCAVAGLTCAAAARAFLRATIQSLPRIATRIGTKAFWHGKGYLFDPAHGGLIHYYSIPRYVIDEVEPYGLQVAEVQPGDYPSNGTSYFTKWYYYVFSKPHVSPHVQPIATLLNTSPSAIEKK